MTTYRIIYSNDTDGVAFVISAPGIEETEAFRDAWQADCTDVPIKE